MARTDTLTNFLTDVADSIRSKTGKSDAIACEDFDTEIESISGGGTVEVQEKDVNFYDYDGTLVDSYSKADFLALNSLPENPTHSGLTAQGWNWSLADAKTYVTNNDELDIGQMYVTDNGRHRIYIEVKEGNLSLDIGFALNGTATIYWGDNTSTIATGSSLSSTQYFSHTYEQEGEYVIEIESDVSIYLRSESSQSALLNDTTHLMNASRVCLNFIQKLEFSNNVLFNTRSFTNCNSLRTLNFPSSTSIESYLFQNDTALNAIVIPNTLTTILNYAFQFCYSLKKVILPSTITSLNSYAFGNCYLLKKITIPPSIRTLPSNCFYNCFGLEEVILPEGVTTIGSDCFGYCYSLSKLVLPSTITTLDSSCFRYCMGVGYFDFTKCSSIPTLSSSNVFGTTRSYCKIVVPDDLYDTWVAATNWSTAANKIIKESDFNA